MNNRYTVGFDKPNNYSKGTFCIWDRKKNTIHKIIETRWSKLWLFWFKLKKYKVFKEGNSRENIDKNTCLFIKNNRS